MLPIKTKDFYTLTFVDTGYYNPDDPVLGVVHCPGLVCMKTNVSLRYGVVIKTPQGIELWKTRGEGVPDNFAWEDILYFMWGLFDLSDFNLHNKLPKEHQKYFLALNLYKRLLPENEMAHTLLNVYQDDGILTRTQRETVDEQFFAGSDVGIVAGNYDMLRCLEILSVLGNRPGLDQTRIKQLVKMAKTEAFAEKDENFVFDTLDKFASLIRPLSTQLVADWPPVDRVLSLY
jgi:hypothetical protein